MKISLFWIGSGRGRSKRGELDLLVEGYLLRAAKYQPVAGAGVETEAAFWTAVDGAAGRTAARVILMDSTGRLLTSDEFAEALGGFRDRGTQVAVVGIGGADGWSAESRARADLVVSMGRLTLPHGLARVVAAEQIYRALTILAGHPYHCGH